MSGGFFDYKQYQIQDIIDSLKEILNNKRAYDEELDCTMNDFRDETFDEFETAIEILKNAHIYTQRIDYLLSDDDGEQSFHERLAEDFKKLRGF